MSNYLRDRWPLAETSTMYMDGTSLYNLVHPTKPGILGTVRMTPEQVDEFRQGVRDHAVEHQVATLAAKWAQQGEHERMYIRDAAKALYEILGY